jgi:hypothetical protein
MSINDTVTLNDLPGVLWKERENTYELSQYVPHVKHKIVVPSVR